MRSGWQRRGPRSTSAFAAMSCVLGMRGAGHRNMDALKEGWNFAAHTFPGIREAGASVVSAAHAPGSVWEPQPPESGTRRA